MGQSVPRNASAWSSSRRDVGSVRAQASCGSTRSMRTRRSRSPRVSGGVVAPAGAMVAARTMRRPNDAAPESVTDRMSVPELDCVGPTASDHQPATDFGMRSAERILALRAGGVLHLCGHGRCAAAGSGFVSRSTVPATTAWVAPGRVNGFNRQFRSAIDHLLADTRERNHTRPSPDCSCASHPASTASIVLSSWTIASIATSLGDWSERTRPRAAVAARSATTPAGFR